MKNKYFNCKCNFRIYYHWFILEMSNRPTNFDYLASKITRKNDKERR